MTWYAYLYVQLRCPTEGDSSAWSQHTPDALSGTNKLLSLQNAPCGPVLLNMRRFFSQAAGTRSCVRRHNPPCRCRHQPCKAIISPSLVTATAYINRP